MRIAVIQVVIAIWMIRIYFQYGVWGMGKKKQDECMIQHVKRTRRIPIPVSGIKCVKSRSLVPTYYGTRLVKSSPRSSVERLH